MASVLHFMGPLVTTKLTLMADSKVTSAANGPNGVSCPKSARQVCPTPGTVALVLSVIRTFPV
jgi:hypothetical protein